MIRLEIDKAVKFRGRSLFLSFPDRRDRQAQLEQLSKLPRRYYHPEWKEWEVPLIRFDDVLNLLDEWDIEIVGDIPDNIKKRLEIEEQMANGDEGELKFKTKPYKHQLECYEYAKQHEKFILGDEQGLGKTKQSIDIAVSRRDKFKHCLIVCCVNGLKWNWQDEIEIHSDEKSKIIGEYITRNGNRVIGSLKERTAELKRGYDEFFLITNIETLRDKEFRAATKELCDSGEIGMIIVDEIHKCKNPSSLQGQALNYLTSYFRMGLTGTPLMSSPEDIYSILKWMGEEHHSFTDFKEHYCVFGGYGGYDIVGYRNLTELQERLDKVMLRRKKDDVLDLPPKIRSTEYVQMPADQLSIYNEVLTSIRQNIDKIRLMPNPLVETIRLRQTTGYPGILSTKVTKSAKLDRMAELVKEAVDSGDKCIIFSNWTQVINPAYDMLKKLKYNPALITGEVDNTQAEKAKFMNDDSCKVILGTTSAMGVGYTLTAGRTVIFLDSPWTRAEKDQAEDRAHRIGTAGAVSIITIVCKDTIDEKIEKIVQGKGLLSDMIVDKMSVETELQLLDMLIF